FKELELTSLAPDERERVFHSSGTSEQKPSRHFHNAESLAVYEASVRPWFEVHMLGDLGADSSALTVTPLTPALSPPAWPKPISRAPSIPLRRGEGPLRGEGGAALRMIFLTPPPALAPHSSLVHMFETVRQSFGVPGSLFTGDVDASGAWELDLERT